jgi:hypothetical protein
MLDVYRGTDETGNLLPKYGSLARKYYLEFVFVAVPMTLRFPSIIRDNSSPEQCQKGSELVNFDLDGDANDEYERGRIAFRLHSSVNAPSKSGRVCERQLD